MSKSEMAVKGAGSVDGLLFYCCIESVNGRDKRKSKNSQIESRQRVMNQWTANV